MPQTAEEAFFYLAAAVFGVAVVHYARSEVSPRDPTEEDWRRLEEAHGFLTFAALHSNAFRIAAIITIIACMWSAMAGFDWPVPVGLMVLGFSFLAANVSWTFYLDYWTQRK